MKRFLITTLLVSVVLCVSGYFIYRSIIREIVAEALVSESVPDYIPKRLKTRVEAIRRPINKGTEAFIERMHHSQIPVEDVLDAIDDISEEEVNSFLDEVNQTKPSSTDEVFTVAKKHFDTDFDLEVFRQPFNEHLEMKQVNNALDYAITNRTSNDVDIATVKAILKKIILEKEKEMKN